MKRRVLFIGTANSARSLMAEALLRDTAGELFDVASAGTAPTEAHPLAMQVLQEAGIAITGLTSQRLSEVQGQHWDYVITLCDEAARECDRVCEPAQQIAWDFADPVPTNRRAAFAATLADIRERISLFALVHQKEVGKKPTTLDPVAVFKAIGDGLRLSALLLIRDQQQLCVCELTEAFDAPQPKVSRHLATLKDAGLLQAERRGQWVYYSLSPNIPPWLTRVLDETARHNGALIAQPLQRLGAMEDRPAVLCG